MLDEAVAELRGEPPSETIDPEITIDVPAFLPDDYVEATSVRLSLYSRLSSAAEADDLTGIREEMEDRFGPLPLEARALLRTLEVKIRLRRLGALGIEAGPDRVALHLSDKTTLDPARVLALVNQKGSTWRLGADMRLTSRRTAKDGLENAEAALGELESIG
jgi:transcription-repair coupling factor (superfamily II helicase)